MLWDAKYLHEWQVGTRGQGRRGADEWKILEVFVAHLWGGFSLRMREFVDASRHRRIGRRQEDNIYTQRECMMHVHKGDSGV